MDELTRTHGGVTQATLRQKDLRMTFNFSQASRLLIGVLAVFIVGDSIVSTKLTAQQDFVVYGIGQSTSCAVWAAQAKNPAARAGALNWVLGFVTGAGAAMPSGALQKTDAMTIETWVNQYCQTR